MSAALAAVARGLDGARFAERPAGYPGDMPPESQPRIGPPVSPTATDPREVERRPDEIDTVSPGLTDESGTLPHRRCAGADDERSPS
jgi:hypothetical protein